MVCAGNLCRSPFAEAYMQKRLDETGAEAECFSRGLIAMPGHSVPEIALKVAREFDIDLGAHVSQPLLGPDIDRAGIILVMEPHHRQRLLSLRPAHIGKVFMLSHPVHGQPIRDPIGQDEACFRTVYGEIIGHVNAWLQRFGVR
ncbi:MAG: hypothetical protein Q9M29_06330 [Mariprofundaceae bacterium]|nr:hypothetical protein [Mariprofundaceae bacterium]